MIISNEENVVVNLVVKVTCALLQCRRQCQAAFQQFSTFGGCSGFALYHCVYFPLISPVPEKSPGQHMMDDGD